MKKFYKMALKFLLMNPEMLVEWIEPLLEKPQVRAVLQKNGPTVRRIIKAMERASKAG